MPTGSLEELRVRCRSSRQEPFGAQLIRHVSIRVTWLFLHTSVSANAVTLLFLVSGLLGSFLLARGDFTSAIIGVALLVVHLILDYVDGEIARYRHSTSWFGYFLELTSHEIVTAALFTSVSYHVYKRYAPNARVFAFGFSAATFLLMDRGFRRRLWYAISSHVPVTPVGNHIARIDDEFSRASAHALAVVRELLFANYGILLILLAAVLSNHLDWFLYLYGVASPMYQLGKIWFVATRLWMTTGPEAAISDAGRD